MAHLPSDIKFKRSHERLASWVASVIIIVIAASFLSVGMGKYCPDLASVKLPVGLMIRAECSSQHLAEIASITHASLLTEASSSIN